MALTRWNFVGKEMSLLLNMLSRLVITFLLSTNFNILMGPIISWEIDGQTVETVAGFIFLGSKVTPDGDCSHEIKRQTFVGKVIPLLLNMLSRLVITFLPRSKRLLISWLQSPSAVILEPPPQINSTTVSPSICNEVMGPDAMILVF